MKKKLKAILAAIDDYVKSIIALVATFVYLGLLVGCFFYAYIPEYAQLFDKILNWSVVPGFIWGAYFVTEAVKSAKSH
jgi:uncharacterized membrane protein YdcZ (DUF606 family)